MQLCILYILSADTAVLCSTPSACSCVPHAHLFSVSFCLFSLLHSSPSETSLWLRGPPVLHCTRLHDDQSPGKNPPQRPLICRSYGETATHWKTLSHKISTVPTRSAKSVVNKTSSHVTEKWAWRRSTQSYTLPPCCFISVIHLYILDWLIDIKCYSVATLTEG